MLLRRLAGAVGSARRLDDLVAAVLPELAAATASDVACLWVTDREGHLTCLHTWCIGDGARAYERWSLSARPTGDGDPVARGLLEPQPVWTAELGTAGDGRGEVAAACGLASSLVVPLVAGSDRLGALELAGRSRAAPTEALLAVVEAAAALLSQSMARLAAEAAKRESDVLLRSMLDTALDAFVATDEDGIITHFSPSAERMFGYTYEEAVGRAVSELIVPPSFRPFHEEGMARHRRTGEGRLVGQRTRLAAMRRDGTQLPVELSLSRLAVPGNVTFAAFIRDASVETQIERALVESGQRFAEQARVLQRSLLSTPADRVPFLDVAVRYVPASDDMEVGGDFFDVFALPGGRWALTVGDVEGKGLEAAAVMARTRFRIREVAQRRPGPSNVIQALNQAFMGEERRRLCTFVYGQLAGLGHRPRLTVGLAGHPLPLHVTGQGVRQFGQPGYALGVVPEVAVTERTIELSPGDVVLFFTDGLTEARSPDGEFLGDGRVHALLDELRERPAEEIAEQLEQLALDFQGGAVRDDIALIVLRVPEDA